MEVENDEQENENNEVTHRYQDKRNVALPCYEPNRTREDNEPMESNPIKSPGSQSDIDKRNVALPCYEPNSPREDNEPMESNHIKSPGSQSDIDSGIGSNLSAEYNDPGSACSLFDPNEVSPSVSTPSTWQQDENQNEQIEMTCTPNAEKSTNPTASLDELQIEEQKNHKQGTIPVLKTNNEVTERGNHAERKQEETIKNFITTLQGNWIYLKDNIDWSMLKMFKTAGLINEDDFSSFNTRSKKADMLLMKVIRRIKTDKDISDFKRIVGNAVCEKLELREIRFVLTQDDDKIKYMNRLHSNRENLITHLRNEDIEKVKDRFVQEHIISLKENEEIIKHPGYCEHNTSSFTEKFVDLIIQKSFLGTYQCLLEYLQEKTNNKCTRLKPLFEMLKNDKIHTDTDDVIVCIRVSQENFQEICSKERTTDGAMDVKIVFNPEDEVEKKVYDAVIVKAKTNNGSLLNLVGGYTNKAESGSVVLQMVAVQKAMIQNIITMFKDGRFARVVKMLLNDKQIKHYLPTGKHKVVVTCYVADKQKSFEQGTCCKVHKLDPISDNKSFLEEEMDTLYVLKELENRGVEIDRNVEENDRKSRARYIMKIALSDQRISKMFHEVLLESEMANVKSRLSRYDTVYSSDASHLKKNICTHFKEITSKVFLDDIRQIFTERNILKEEIFEAEDQTGEENEVAMSNILTEIIKYNSAMLTLVDALFQIELDALATKLINPESFVVKKMDKKTKEPVCINKQVMEEKSDKLLLLYGEFQVSIWRRPRIIKTKSSTTESLTQETVSYKRKCPMFENKEDISINGVRDKGGYSETAYHDDINLTDLPQAAENKNAMYPHLDNGCNDLPANSVTNKSLVDQQNEEECMDQSNRDASPEMVSSPASTTVSSESGYCTNLDVDCNTNTDSSSSRTMCKLDSDRNTQLETEDILMVRTSTYDYGISDSSGR